MKRYLITTKDVSFFDGNEDTSLAETKNTALSLLSIISNNNDQELVSVIEVDIYTAHAVKLEPYLNEKLKFDLREKQ